VPGRVFVSCGQRPPDETRIAERVAAVLRDEFDLSPYLAFKIQSLSDIMAITRELKGADYYLLIDFRRKPAGPQDLACSLFTHQELALANHLGFGEQVIALQQTDAPLEGFLRYVLSNPERFETEEELIAAVRRLVAAKGWKPSYSRNLVLGPLTADSQIYQDHTGRYHQKIWQLRVENRRPDVASLGTICVLDGLRLDGSWVEPGDRAYLEWAGQAAYERTIFPEDFAKVNLLTVERDQPGLFLHSLRNTPRIPLVRDDGDYELHFKIFSLTLPMVHCSVRVALRWSPDEGHRWAPATSATVIEESGDEPPDALQLTRPG
jgi:hypothetical protein